MALDDGTVDELLINLSATGVNVENATLYDSSAMVMAGQYLTIVGGGYKAGATVTVDVGTQAVDTVTANAWGRSSTESRSPLPTRPGPGLSRRPARRPTVASGSTTRSSQLRLRKTNLEGRACKLAITTRHPELQISWSNHVDDRRSRPL